MRCFKRFTEKRKETKSIYSWFQNRWCRLFKNWLGSTKTCWWKSRCRTVFSWRTWAELRVATVIRNQIEPDTHGDSGRIYTLTHKEVWSNYQWRSCLVIGRRLCSERLGPRGQVKLVVGWPMFWRGAINGKVSVCGLPMVWTILI